MTPGGYPKDMENAAVCAFVKKIPFFFAKVSYYQILSESFLGFLSKSNQKI